MAKKRTLNPFEAHVEKLILVLTIGVFGWVLATRFINPPGVVNAGSGETLSAYEATQQGAREAEEIVGQIRLPDSRVTPSYAPVAVKFFDGTSLFNPEGPTVRAPLGPIHRDMTEQEEIRLYAMPEIPAIKDIKAVLTSTVAWVPTESTTSKTSPYGLAVEQQSDSKKEDVDFVTVSAVLSMAELNKSFKKCFGPDVKDPLDQYEPVVALVDLQRCQLRDDGSWSEYQSVSRLEVDPVKDAPTLPAIQKLSQGEYQAILATRHDDYQTQLDLLQPFPYELVDESGWQSPLEIALEGKEQKDTVPGAPAPVIRRQPRTRVSRGRDASPTMPPGIIPGMPPGMIPGMPPGMFIPGRGPGTVPGRQPTAPRVGRQSSSIGIGQSQTRPAELLEEEFIFWAFDGQIEPGGTYTYRLQIGFFNPITGHNWFKEDEKQFKDQRVLWSNWLAPDRPISVPRRTFFFPKTSFGDLADASVRVDVFRKQNGRWYQKEFTVAPGSEIGAIVEEEPPKETGTLVLADSRDVEESLDIDYRTGVTVIDVVPNSKHWDWDAGAKTKARDKTCTDIIYRDVDKIIKRLGTEKFTWPREMYKMSGIIAKEVRDQKKEESQQNQNRTNPGGRIPGQQAR